MKPSVILIVTLFLFGFVFSLKSNESSCDIKDYFKAITTKKICLNSDNLLENKIYILYDVNPVEGFNLRRDVYIRMAVFVHNLRKKSIFHNVKLVLPPFPRLYHWKSSYLDQNLIFWNHF